MLPYLYYTLLIRDELLRDKRSHIHVADVRIYDERQRVSIMNMNKHLSKSSTPRIPLWVSIVVVLGAIVTVVGAVISKVNPSLLTNGSQVTDAVRVYADYTFSRNLSLAAMLLFLLLIGNRRILAAFMVLISLIQFIDVINDLIRGAYLLVPGLLVFVIVFLYGASSLFKQAFWRIDAWRE